MEREREREGDKEILGVWRARVQATTRSCPVIQDTKNRLERNAVEGYGRIGFDAAGRGVHASVQTKTKERCITSRPALKNTDNGSNRARRRHCT